MNRWLVRGPWWALGIVLGLAAALPFGLVIRFEQHAGSVSVAVQTAVFVVVVGPVMGLIVRRQLDRLLDGVGDVPDELRERVASWPTAFGALPRHPAERAATLRLIENQLGEFRRKRPRLIITGVLFAAPLVWLSLTRSPWWWLLAGAWLGLIVLGLCTPGSLRRRADTLRQE